MIKGGGFQGIRPTSYTVQCPSCGWTTQRRKSSEEPGGYGSCTQQRCDGQDRVLRPMPERMQTRGDRIARELKGLR